MKKIILLLLTIIMCAISFNSCIEKDEIPTIDKIKTNKIIDQKIIFNGHEDFDNKWLFISESKDKTNIKSYTNDYSEDVRKLPSSIPNDELDYIVIAQRATDHRMVVELRLDADLSGSKKEFALDKTYKYTRINLSEYTYVNSKTKTSNSVSSFLFRSKK